MLQRNNTIVVTVFVALLFLAAIPMDWLTTSMNGSESTVTGHTAHLLVPGVASLPVWIPLCGSAAMTLVAGLNFLRVTAVHFLVLTASLALGGLYYALPFFFRDDPVRNVSVSLGAGPYVAVTATFAATLLALRRPMPSRVSRPDLALGRTSPRYASVRR